MNNFFQLYKGNETRKYDIILHAFLSEIFLDRAQLNFQLDMHAILCHTFSLNVIRTEIRQYGNSESIAARDSKCM